MLGLSRIALYTIENTSLRLALPHRGKFSLMRELHYISNERIDRSAFPNNPKIFLNMHRGNWSLLLNSQPLCTSARGLTASGFRQLSTQSSTPSPSHDESNLSLKEKMSRYFKKYRWWFVGTYVTVYAVFFSIMYLLVESGVDMVKLLAKLGVGNVVDLSLFDSGTGKVVQAFMLNKLLSPIRIPLAFAFTPVLAKFVRHRIPPKMP